MTADDEPWNLEQVTDAMLEVAIAAASSWAGVAFLMIDTGLSIVQPGDEPEFRAWAAGVAGGIALSVIEESGVIAAGLQASPAQRACFIAGRVCAYNARLDALMTLCGQRGTA